MVKSFITWLALISCLTWFGTHVYARPKLLGVKSDRLLPGEQAELTLIGTGFDEIMKVDAIQIGGIQAVIIKQSVTSDTTIYLVIRVPKRLGSGRHSISVVVTGLTFTERLESQIEGGRGSEIQLQIEGVPISDAQAKPVDFGSTRKDSSITREFLIKNTGSKPLVLIPPELPPGFHLDGTFPENIPPGSGGFFQIRFQGDSVGTYSGKIKFEFITNSRKTFEFPVAGRVEPPPMPDIELIVDNRVVTLNDTAWFQFGNLPTDSAVRKTIFLKNTGRDVLHLSPPVMPGGFQMVGVYPDSLLPGQSVSFGVEFRGDSAKTYHGIIQLAIAEFPDYPLKFRVTGTSVPRVPGAPGINDSTQIVVTPPGVNPPSDSPAGTVSLPPASTVSQKQRPGWWVILVLTFAGILILFGVRYIYGKLKRTPAETNGGGALPKPSFYFKTQQDWGSLHTDIEGETMVKFSLRLKPVMDWGKTGIEHEGDSLVNERKFEKNKTNH